MGGDIVFDLADNNADVRVVASKQLVSNGSKKKPKLSDEQYEDIKEQISKMEKNMTRRIDRLQGTVAFTAKCIEDFNDNFSAIMEVVKEQRIRGVSNNILHEVTFPFQSTVDVAAYVEQDPQMVKLIDRYVGLIKAIGFRRLPFSKINAILHDTSHCKLHLINPASI